MIQRSSVHDTFTVERVYPASPARVFRAWATPERKARWFSGPPDRWTELERSLDFRVGGRERARGAFTGGPVSCFEAVYLAITDERRIVYAYTMHLDDRLISASLATIEFLPEGSGTRLVITEQGAFLDGFPDGGSRRQGTEGLMEQLAQSLDEG